MNVMLLSNAQIINLFQAINEVPGCPSSVARPLATTRGRLRDHLDAYNMAATDLLERHALRTEENKIVLNDNRRPVIADEFAYEKATRDLLVEKVEVGDLPMLKNVGMLDVIMPSLRPTIIDSLSPLFEDPQ